MAQRSYVGTELKFAVTISSAGFSMDTDPWTVTVTNGQKSVVCEKVEDDLNHQHYILLDTAVLGKGTYNVTIEIDVPDEDFEDDYRHEVWKKEGFLTVR